MRIKGLISTIPRPWPLTLRAGNFWMALNCEHLQKVREILENHSLGKLYGYQIKIRPQKAAETQGMHLLRPGHALLLALPLRFRHLPGLHGGELLGHVLQRHHLAMPGLRGAERFWEPVGIDCNFESASFLSRRSPTHPAATILAQRADAAFVRTQPPLLPVIFW